MPRITPEDVPQIHAAINALQTRESNLRFSASSQAAFDLLRTATDNKSLIGDAAHEFNIDSGSFFRWLYLLDRATDEVSSGALNGPAPSEVWQAQGEWPNVVAVLSRIRYAATAMDAPRDGDAERGDVFGVAGLASASSATRRRPNSRKGKTRDEHHQEIRHLIHRAMSLLSLKPDRTAVSIATELGISPSMLSKDKEWQKAVVNFSGRKPACGFVERNNDVRRLHAIAPEDELGENF
jgi:hypothetical protein